MNDIFTMCMHICDYCKKQFMGACLLSKCTTCKYSFCEWCGEHNCLNGNQHNCLNGNQHIYKDPKCVLCKQTFTIKHKHFCDRCLTNPKIDVWTYSNNFYFCYCCYEYFCLHCVTVDYTDNYWCDSCSYGWSYIMCSHDIGEEPSKRKITNDKIEFIKTMTKVKNIKLKNKHLYYFLT